MQLYCIVFMLHLFSRLVTQLPALIQAVQIEKTLEEEDFQQETRAYQDLLKEQVTLVD